MIGQDLIATGIYLISAFVLFWIGKLVKDLTTTSYSVREELVEKDNVALGVAMAGYYFGLIMAIGGTLSGPSQGLENDLIDIGIYGLLAIILLNLSRLVNDGVILHGFKIRDELINDQNAGTGAVIAASYIATGLVIFGAVSGEIGGIVTTVIFWALGQVALVLAGLVYEWITPYSIHDEIEKDNVAAGVAFAGALVGIGIIVFHASAGNFISWTVNLQDFAIEVVAGLILLPIVRFISDVILLPGQKLTDEIANQEHPNLGAGFIEATSYVGASFLIVWSL
ncbi:MAG: DUF350 domain-containing protein [Gemmatimonadetes bacterium]|nr:DUF350 domain-containing protein [Gemmatimonadota bacterium]MYC14722.1 DUF350 domain-containing protein [Gemmatimonadota bacterium]MYF73677.1 DUF350 domain-containing protein [Gemmatimonadota bacterium]MYK54277.1 DUF350 domain-containing protein [Gemmatimonadota bacterium]